MLPSLESVTRVSTPILALAAFALVNCGHSVAPGNDADVVDASSHDDSDVTAPDWWTSYVSLTQYAPPLVSAGLGHGVVAGWLLSAAPLPNDTFSSTTIDGCTVRHYQGWPLSDGGTLSVQDDAGVLTASFLSGSPYLVALDDARWHAGEVLHVAATGGEFPAFAGEVTFPGDVAVTSPSMPDPHARLSVRMSDGLTATWTGGADALVALFLYGCTGSTEATPMVSATCTVDASAGRVTASPGVLRELLGTTTLSVELMTEHVAVVPAAARRIELRAQSLLLDAPLVLTSP